MKKDNQESVILIGYSEDRLKKVLHSIIHESFDILVKDKMKSADDEKEYVTIPAAAKFLNKTVRTLYNWIEQNRLQRYYIGDSPYLKKSDLINLPTNKSKK